jgi:alpha-1,3-rhamnosyl/mannosyltransferase
MHGAKYRNAAATCDVVFANSRYTANDTVQLLGIEPERVHVAYPAIDARFAPKGPRAHLGGPYVLAVSTLEPRKNLGALLAAFDRLAHRRPELRLVVAGATGWGTLERPADERVRLLGFVEDDRLAELYRGAAVFAYPSRFEGFGLPVVEALASGTPAVASAHASLDEASGDTALRADPDDAVAFAEALEHALALPEEARRRGVEHARAFTPLRCGQAVLAGYEAALRH